MTLKKHYEISKAIRKIKNNCNYDYIYNFIIEYNDELNLNLSKIDEWIKEVLNKIISSKKESLNFNFLNLKYKKTSKEYWLIRGWNEDYSINKAKECNKVYSHKIQLKENGYSDEEIKNIMLKRFKKGAQTLKNRSDYDEIRKKYGHKVDKYLKRINANTNKNYTLEEAKTIISEIQRKKSKRKWEKHKLNPRFDKINTRLEFYLAKGLNKEEAENALYERQIKNGLNYYINKYGLEKGKEKYNKRIEEYRKKIKLHRKKYPQKWITSGKRYSDSSKRFFDKIIEEITELKDMKIYYAENEYFIFDEKRKIYFYDFYIKELNLIIEYNGLVWHPKERIQKNWKHVYTKKSSETYYDYDRYKEQLAISKGIDIMSIFEDELIYKRKQIINELYSRINKIKNN